MIGLYITVTIVFGVVCSIGLFCYFHYKSEQFDFQKNCGKQNEAISIKALELEIEKENTRQMEIDADAYKEKEHTRQYEIKSNYKDKQGERLYL